MAITVQLLQANIQLARKQEAENLAAASACAGAAQAYEQLLSNLIQSQKIEQGVDKSALSAAGFLTDKPHNISTGTRKARRKA